MGGMPDEDPNRVRFQIEKGGSEEEKRQISVRSLTAHQAREDVDLHK
jgi:hypothetical protein